MYVRFPTVQEALVFFVTPVNPCDAWLEGQPPQSGLVREGQVVYEGF